MMSLEVKISLPRKIAMLFFNMAFRFLPEYCQPYAKPFNWIKLGALRIALARCGTGVNVGFACAVSPRVEIGDYSSFGNRCVVQGGVRIGSHAVIGAGAIVTKDVPEYAVVGGNPARVLKYRGQMAAENTKQNEAIK